MAQNVLLEALEIRKKELLGELDAIEALIAVYSPAEITSTDQSRIVRTRRNNSEASTKTFAPKGSMSWIDYTIKILESLGEAKASDISEIAIAANPRIDKQTVSNAITGKLSNLFRLKKIDAVKGISVKDGYTYKIKKEPEGS